MNDPEVHGNRTLIVCHQNKSARVHYRGLSSPVYIFATALEVL
jgi:hypothetical protein